MTSAGNIKDPAAESAPKDGKDTGKDAEQARRMAQTDRLFRALTFTILAVFHFTAVLAWLAPPSFARDAVLRGTRRYTRTLKADQAWPMFAPDPLSFNRRIVLLANLNNGESREIDITTPVNRNMRSFNFARVGKKLKAHDRVISGGERQFERGFLIHECAELSAEWHTSIRDLVMYRDFNNIEMDTRAYRSRIGNSQRVAVTTQVCPTEL